jgi:hypothetical protein
MALSKREVRANSPIGAPLHGGPKNEADHFYTCSHCGQAVDKRYLSEVMHHELGAHEPLTEDA